VSNVKLKKAQNRQVGDSSTPAQGIFGKKPCRGDPRKRAGAPAAYRLGVNIGDRWRSPRKVTGWENPQWPSDPLEIKA
jgi:hypothetical protein